MQRHFFSCLLPSRKRPCLSRRCSKGKNSTVSITRRNDAALPDNVRFLSRYSFEAAHEPAAEGDGQGPQSESLDAGLLSLKGLGILPAERKSLDDIPETIGRLAAANRVVIVASSTGQAERLKDLFREKNIILPFVEKKELAGFQGHISLTVGSLSSGMFLEGLMVLTERELFGERPSARPIMKSKVSKLLASLDEIAAGDFIVHREHGIGRFIGTVRQGSGENELELMQIEYEDGRLYIPVQNIQIISKYRAEEGAAPKADKLGGQDLAAEKREGQEKSA